MKQNKTKNILKNILLLCLALRLVIPLLCVLPLFLICDLLNLPEDLVVYMVIGILITQEFFLQRYGQQLRVERIQKRVQQKKQMPHKTLYQFLFLVLAFSLFFVCFKLFILN